MLATPVALGGKGGGGRGISESEGKDGMAGAPSASTQLHSKYFSGGVQ